MSGAATRIGALILRYCYLHKRSLPRTLEIVFWPVMELLVWGFVSVYVQSLTGGVMTHAIVFFINSMIFWDILYRSQQGVSISVIEEIWTQNIVNLLVSPLKIWEWMAATFVYGLLKTTTITVILGIIAWLLYRFDLIGATGLYLVPLVANLLFFGWALGVFASALVIRWGHAAEALIWGIPFLIQPLSAIFYPLETLPVWLRPFSMALPSTYVFEGMREVLKTGRMSVFHLAAALALNVVFFALCAVFFDRMYKQARDSGRLGRLGTD
jgi:ABC-2 type transport system permease protein